jgi:voltage-dependent calcium channel alpha-2/delta-3
LGKFLGSVENKMMKILLDDQVYQKVVVYDYQAVCYEDKDIKYELLMELVSGANALLSNPFKYVWSVLGVLASSLWNLVLAARSYVPYRKYQLLNN